MISSWCLGPEGCEEFSSTCDDLEEKISANWGLQIARPWFNKEFDVLKVLKKERSSDQERRRRRHSFRMRRLLIHSWEDSHASNGTRDLPGIIPVLETKQWQTQRSSWTPMVDILAKVWSNRQTSSLWGFIRHRKEFGVYSNWNVKSGHSFMW